MFSRCSRRLGFTGFTACVQVPNATQTAASASTDLNGQAVLDACNKSPGRYRKLPRDPPGDEEDAGSTRITLTVCCAQYRHF